MNSNNLIENWCLRRQKRISDLKAATEPMFWIENIVRVTVLLFFQKSCLCRITIETNGKKGNLFNNFIFRHFLLFEIINTKRNELYFIEYLTLINPQVFWLLADWVKQVNIYLWRNGSEFSSDLELLFQSCDTILLEEGKLEVLGVADKMIEHSNTVNSILCFWQIDITIFLFVSTFCD